MLKVKPTFKVDLAGNRVTVQELKGDAPALAAATQAANRFGWSRLNTGGSTVLLCKVRAKPTLRT